MTRTKILRRLIEEAPRLLDARAKPGPRCVLASAIGQMVLERFDLYAKPFSAEVSVCNAAWIDWAEDGYPGGQEEQLRRGAYILTNAPSRDGVTELPSLNPPTSKSWYGHLALQLGETLIELDSVNLSRPAKQLLLPPAFSAPFNAQGAVVGSFHGPQGSVTHLMYRRMVSPVADDFLTAKDWVERDRYVADIDQLERLIRKG